VSKKNNKIKMEDKNLKCIDCNSEFIFTEGEQEFYSDKGYQTPKRCPDCRAINKKKKESRESGRSDGNWGKF